MISAQTNLFENATQLIDGRDVQSSSEATLAVVNPSDGAELAQIPAGTNADVDAAVLSGRKAFDAGFWSTVPAPHRKRVLHRLADLIAKDAALFDFVDAKEMGKPIATKRFNAAGAADLFRFFAESVDKIAGTVLPTDGNSLQYLRKVPRGVVGAITPWNFPTQNGCLKIAPALAAGNSVVLKPSEMSSFSALRLGRLALEAGLPPGVLNVVLGSGSVAGKALALHDDVDMITFTGSTAVGRLMLQYAGQSNMKKVVAECGGKCPQIVFDDGVDLNAAADFIALFLLTNQGQVCSSGTRLLVQKSIERELVALLADRFAKVSPGDATNPDVDFGPLVNRTQMEKVMALIDWGKTSDAELVIGGERILTHTGGNFVAPTIFGNVAPNARIAQEEIFGPVLSVIPFETEAEAITMANATRFGLNAYVWTADLQRGMRMAEAIRSTVSVRSGVTKGIGPGPADSKEPFGDSGTGLEGGLEGLNTFMRTHSTGFYY